MNTKNTSKTLFSSRPRLPVRATPYVFALYMSVIMAFLMSLVITAANTGIDAHYLTNTWEAYKLAMPAAFLCILVVRPVVLKLVSMTVHPHR